MNVTTATLTDPQSFLQPCEAGRTAFLPVGERGPCPNRRMLTVGITGAERSVELCSEHAQALQNWAAS